MARPVATPKGGQLLTTTAFALLVLFVFAIPLENALVLPGVGTFGRLVGLAAFAVGIFAVIEKGQLRSPLPVHLVMLAYVIWASLTYFWTVSPDDTVEEVLSYVQFLAMVWLIWELAPLPRQRVNLMQAYLVGTGVSAVGALLHIGAAAGVTRNSTFNMNPNDIGLRLAISVPMALYLAASEKQDFRVWLYRLHMIVASCALFMTGSRGALIALCGSFLMIPLTFRKWTFRQKLVMANRGGGRGLHGNLLRASQHLGSHEHHGIGNQSRNDGRPDSDLEGWPGCFSGASVLRSGCRRFPRRYLAKRGNRLGRAQYVPIGFGRTRRRGFCDIRCFAGDADSCGVTTAGAGPQLVVNDAADLGLGRLGNDLGKHQAYLAAFWFAGC